MNTENTIQPVDLIEHPEGGRFKEVFRSIEKIRRADGTERRALTHIYFSLKKEEVSKFHKVSSDEVWNLYKGDGIRLYLWDGTESEPDMIELSIENNSFCYVVPAGIWQAAEPICVSDRCEDILVGCSVGPGFEFEDFELIDKDSDEAKLLGQEWGRFC